MLIEINGKGNSWRGDWQGEFLKGRVRRTLLFFFLVMYSAIPSFFFEKHACNVFITTSSYAFWLRHFFFHKCCAVLTIIKETGSGC